MILSSIREQHPFTWARERFLAGDLLVSQAIEMMVKDNEFAYEALLAGMTARQAAEMVVREVWMKELVEIAAQRKRGLALLQP